jgi:hypothetical protein
MWRSVVSSKASRWFIALALLQACGSGGDDKSQVQTPGSNVVTPVDMTPVQTNQPPAVTGSGGASSAPVQKPAGTAGNPSMQPTMHAPDPAMDPMMPVDMQPAPTLAMDECGLKTKWAGDEYCIKPPPADKGFQIHVGPSDYDNPEPDFVMEPGTETVSNYQVTSGNAQDVYYYWRQYRMRPGSHHMILYGGSGGGFGGFGGGNRLGGSQNLAKDNPENGKIAPENQDVGMTLAANSPITVNLHYMNYTEKPIIKEIWVNFWYRDAKDVKEPALELFSMVPMNVAPGQHVILSGSCPVTGTGHVITLYGHRHANNVRFSAWRDRNGTRELVYDDYNWEDPLVLEMSSLVTNTPADMTKMVPGGWSGPLDLTDGDNMYFECEIVNNTQSTFVGQNEAKDDEMCILVGDTVGATVSPLCTSNTQNL